jgi:peptide/nickel transport system permease protein
MTTTLPGGPAPVPTLRRASTGRAKVRRSGIRAAWPAMVPFACIVFIAIFLVGVTPFSPTHVSGGPSIAPNATHWFGTDSAGLDVFSRVIAATRINLLIALMVSVLATVVGILLGLLLGMNEAAKGVRGQTAQVTARVIDLVEAIPGVVIGLIAVAFYGANIVTLTLAMAFILFPIQMRLTRTEVLRVRSEAYLDAARMKGMSETALTIRHVMPNASWGALENSSVIFAVSIILTAGLGFIGVGLPPPTPEWGSMLSRGASDAIAGRWWSAAFPAVALAVTVASVSLFAGALFRVGRR